MLSTESAGALRGRGPRSKGSGETTGSAAGEGLPLSDTHGAGAIRPEGIGTIPGQGPVPSTLADT